MTSKLIIVFIAFGLLLSSCSIPKKSGISQDYIAYLNDTADYQFWFNDSPNNATDFFINGATLEQQGYYANAIIEYIEALRTDTNAVIYYAIGKCYSYLYKPERAEEYLIKAIQLDSSFYPALELLATLYISTYKRDKAVKALEELISINRNRKYIHNLAYLYEFFDEERAIYYYNQMLEFSEDYFTHMKLASLYYSNNNTDKYLHHLRKALLYSPSNYETITELICAYLTNNMYSDAQSLFEEYKFRFMIDELDYMFDLMAQQLITDRSEDSKRIKSALIEQIDSRFYFNWRLQLFTGMLAEQIDDTIKSEAAYKKAISYADSIPGIALQLANFYITQNKYQAAVNILDTFAPFHPKDERYPFMHGIALSLMDSLRESVSYLLIALKIDPENSLVLTRLGITYDRLDMIDSSDFYYQMAIKANPDDAIASNNYAYSLSLRGIQLDTALELSAMTLESDPNNHTYLDTYGWILFKMGRKEEALEYVLKATESADVTSEVLEHLGDIYLELGRKQDALDAWMKGLEIEPENSNLTKRIKDNK